MAKIINKFGELIGWASMTFNMLGRDLEGITAVEYSDEKAIESAYGAGSMPVGYVTGNYSATASVTVYKDELVALMKSLPPGLRIQDLPPVPMVVNYEHGDQIFKDVLQNVKFKNAGTTLTQGEGKVEVKLDLYITHIDWNL
jgi:hypothetical protein